METTNIINDLLKGSYKGYNFIEMFYTNSFEKWTLCSIGVSFILFLFLYNIPLASAYSKYILLVSVLLILLYSISSAFITPFIFLLNPAKDSLKHTAIKLENQTFLAQRISLNNSWNIENALSRINQDIDNIQSRVRFLVGAFDKLGVVPAVIGLYITMANIFEEATTNNEQWFMLDDTALFYITAFIVGVYLGAFLSTNLISKYNEFKLVLTQAKKLAVERETIQSGSIRRN